MSNNQNQGASIEAERAACIEIVKRLGWTINGTWVLTPSGEQLHTLDALAFIREARRTPAAAVVAGELLPLPELIYHDYNTEDVEDMLRVYGQECARAAIEADRAQRQAAPASAQPADPTLMSELLTVQELPFALRQRVKAALSAQPAPLGGDAQAETFDCGWCDNCYSGNGKPCSSPRTAAPAAQQAAPTDVQTLNTNAVDVQKSAKVEHKAAARMVEDAAHEAEVEAEAKKIYSLFEGAKDHPWVERGNSNKQDEARRLARSALTQRAALAAQQAQASARSEGGEHG